MKYYLVIICIYMSFLFGFGYLVMNKFFFFVYLRNKKFIMLCVQCRIKDVEDRMGVN